MRTSIQKARDYRELKKKEHAEVPLPGRPDDMRLGIVFLYAACCASLMFLIISGDVQWREARLAGVTSIQIALIKLGVGGILAGLCGFALSRSWTIVLYPVYALAVAGLGILGWIGADLFVRSSGLFVCDLLTTLMVLAAIFFFTRKTSRQWIADVRRIRGPLFGGKKEQAASEAADEQQPAAGDSRDAR